MLNLLVHVTSRLLKVNTIGISNLEQMSVVSTCMVVCRKSPAVSTTTAIDTEDTAGARIRIYGVEMGCEVLNTVGVASKFKLC